MFYWHSCSRLFTYEVGAGEESGAENLAEEIGGGDVIMSFASEFHLRAHLDLI